MTTSTTSKLLDKRKTFVQDAKTALNSSDKGFASACIDHINNIDQALNIGEVTAELSMTSDQRYQAVTRGQNSYLKHWALGTKPEGTEGVLFQSRFKNSMSTSTGSEGGFAVPASTVSAVTQNLTDYSAVRKAAAILPTNSGEDFNYPLSDDSAEIGELLPQNQQRTSQDATFGNVTIKSHMYDSKAITVPIELLQDSNFDFEAFLSSRVSRRIAKISNQHFTNGNGTTQPPGIVPAASAGIVDITGNATSVTENAIYDLVNSVDEAYHDQPGTGFMLNRSTLSAIQKLEVSTPLWRPANGTQPATIAGHQYFVNRDMPDMAASAKSILFGDLSKFVIRDVRELVLFKMSDSNYLLNGQVGFIAYFRMGSGLIDVGSPIKYYQNSAS